MDYVKEVKGDTLVIKDYADMGDKPNSLYHVLIGDSIYVPAGRVYELQAGGWYPLANNPYTSSKHPTVIVGSDPTMVVNNNNAVSSPPLISLDISYISSTAGIAASNDIIIKNCALVPAANDGSFSWVFAGTGVSNMKLVFDNCIMERTRWIFVGIFNANCNVTFRNCYFVNMSGQPCRRNGGVFDSFASVDTLLVENCTHIMAQGNMYRFRNDQFKRIIFNHNTFINCAGSVFMNRGYQNKYSLTNNIFINCNVQPYQVVIDDGEAPDPDLLPMGLVNVNPYLLDSVNNPIRRYYVDKNLVYWDPLLSNVVDTVNQLEVNGHADWQSQMITMNSRTDSMFKNNVEYPYLIEGDWYKQKLNFTDPRDLFSTQLVNLKIFAVTTVDTGVISQSAILPTWRLVNTGADKYVYPDWPIPVDLSYNNTDLLTNGLGGFPIGDLNWFPTQKAAWLAQKDAEYTTIQNILYGTLGVEKENTQPLEFALYQNYPNPFNPSTMIRFSIPKAGNAKLKVYNILGEEAATLLNGYTTSGTHEVQFNAANLASGVYLYHLKMNEHETIRKMVLLK